MKRCVIRKRMSMRLLGAALVSLLSTASVEAAPPDGNCTVLWGMPDGDLEVCVTAREWVAPENVTPYPALGNRTARAPACPPTALGSQPGAEVLPQDVVIRIVYDDSVRTEGLDAAAGFSCLVAVGHVSILFDTGGNGTTLLSNMEKLGIEAAGLDYIGLSHLHSDHVCGLPALLEECEDPVVLVPATLPDNLSGRAEELVTAAVASARERAAAVIEVREPVQVCEGVYSTGQMGTRIPEQALIIHTRRGLVVLTGCAHPGVAEIATAAKELLGEDVVLVIGGMHMEGRSRSDMEAAVSELAGLTRWVAPCHCTGNEARAFCRTEFGDRYIDVGAGSTLHLGRLVEN
jgi:7,8-dihydropterin-6-yl-methyl-4-(beta-D-ribofuranosyl)aminobenzene 5'-phosphate synthase